MIAFPFKVGTPTISRLSGGRITSLSHRKVSSIVATGSADQVTSSKIWLETRSFQVENFNYLVDLVFNYQLMEVLAVVMIKKKQPWRFHQVYSSGSVLGAD